MSAITLAIILLSYVPSTLALFGKSKPKPKESFLSKIIPLLVLFIVIVVALVIGYLIYQTLMSVSSSVQKQLDDKNIKVSRTGADVTVKSVSYEQVNDMTQK